MPGVLLPPVDDTLSNVIASGWRLVVLLNPFTSTAFASNALIVPLVEVIVPGTPATVSETSRPRCHYRAKYPGRRKSCPPCCSLATRPCQRNCWRLCSPKLISALEVVTEMPAVVEFETAVLPNATEPATETSSMPSEALLVVVSEINLDVASRCGRQVKGFAGSVQGNVRQGQVAHGERAETTAENLRAGGVANGKSANGVAGTEVDSVSGGSTCR